MSSEIQPKIAGKQPRVLELEPGRYYWCACGQSNSQPFCDGSHISTPFSPKEFVLETKQEVALCMCKRSGNKPFCDGSHVNV